MRINIWTATEFVVFTTRAYALACDVSSAAAAKQLARRADNGLLVRVTRGVWANTSHPYFTPLACVPHLLGNEQGYVSFLSALHRHGLVSQIPGTIQVATTGHSRQLTTPVGTFEFLQVKPELMQEGIEWSESHAGYRIATAEKALFDTLYISTRRGRRFARLPELDLDGTSFSARRFQALLRNAPLPATIARAMARRSDELLSQAHSAT